MAMHILFVFDILARGHAEMHFKHFGKVEYIRIADGCGGNGYTGVVFDH